MQRATKNVFTTINRPVSKSKTTAIRGFDSIASPLVTHSDVATASHRFKISKRDKILL